MRGLLLNTLCFHSHICIVYWYPGFFRLSDRQSLVRRLSPDCRGNHAQDVRHEACVETLPRQFGGRHPITRDCLSENSKNQEIPKTNTNMTAKTQHCHKLTSQMAVFYKHFREVHANNNVFTHTFVLFSDLCWMFGCWEIQKHTKTTYDCENTVLAAFASLKPL